MELKSCPKCGVPPKIGYACGEYLVYGDDPECPYCGHDFTEMHSSEKLEIDAWNRRVEMICGNCLHREVCGKYTATGGVNKCENFKEERHGRCRFCEDYDIICEVVCYLPHDNGGATDIPIKYCPNCGTPMDGGNEDG